MDNITTSKSQLNILSIVFFKPPSDVKQPILTQSSNDIPFGKGQDATAEEQSQTFKNVCIALPTPKRKNDFTKNQKEKRRKVNDDAKVFNYLTGVYETVGTAITEESFNRHVNLKEELISIEEHVLISDERKPYFCETDIKQRSNSGSVPSVNNGLNNSSVKNEFSASILESLLKYPLPTKNKMEKDCSSTGSLLLDFDLKNDSPKCNLHLNSTDVTNSSTCKMESTTSKCSSVSDNLSLPRTCSTLSSIDNLQTDTLQNPVEPDIVIVSSTGINCNKNSQVTHTQKAQHCSNSILEMLLNSGSQKANKLETCLEKKFKNTTFPPTQYKCKSCAYKAETKSDLISHIYNLHLKDDYVITFKCRQCNFESEDKNEVKRHEKNHDATFAVSKKQTNQNGNSTVPGNKTLVVALRREDFSQHINNQSKLKNPIPKCFDCDKFFSEKEELESHAFLMHFTSSFECDLHSSKDDVHLCSKCCYALILRNIQRENMNCCEDQNDDNVNSDTDISEITWASESGVLNEQIDNNSKTIVNAPTDAETVLSLSNKKSDDIKFQCFDCPYSVIGDGVQFRCHVAKHVGSKLYCMYHIETKNEDCFRCSYETILRDTPIYYGNDLNCGFATADCTLVKEENTYEKLTKKEPDLGELKCFHCEYVTSHKKNLFYHAVDHVDEKFVCKEHFPNKENCVCLGCIYENCLEAAKRDILYCDKCGFKTAVIEVFDIHQFKVGCDNSTAFQKYKCWDCDSYSTSTIGELRRHAIVHDKSSFSCLEHNSLVENCSKCVYQTIVKSLEQSVFTCEKCYYKTLSENCYNRHKLNKCEVVREVYEADQLSCFLCEYKCKKRNLLIYHCKQHSDEQFNCDENHKLKQNDCQKCTFQGILEYVKKSLFVCDKCNFKTFNSFHFKSHITETCDIIVSSESRLFYKCFDCDLVFRTVHHLKRHAEIHTYSLFTCDDHESFDHTCIHCTYESIVKEITSSIFTCQKCGFKTYVWNHFQAHEKSYANCQLYKAKLIVQGRHIEPKPIKIYKCFDCDFSHERLNFIKTHVKVHQGSRFKCDQHKNCTANCAKCFYRQLLIDGTIPRFFCFDCVNRPHFSHQKALYKHVSMHHRESFFACRSHNTKAEADCRKCSYQSVVQDIMGDNYVQITCCDCAGIFFPDKVTLKEHIRYLHPKSKFICDEHNEMYKIGCNKCLYEKSLKTCRKSTFYCKKHIGRCCFKTCPECLYSFTVSGKLEGHIRCYACKSPKTFTRLESLKTHIAGVHQTCSYACPVHHKDGVSCEMCWFQVYAQKILEEMEYRCFECYFKTPQLGSLRRHIREKHMNSSFKCETHKIAVEHKCRKCLYQKIISAPRRLRCYECNHFPHFPNLRNLETHIGRKHIRCLFICHKHSSLNDNCDQCYFQNLIREKLKFICWDCDSIFLDKELLKSHIAQLHRRSNFICSLHALCPEPDSCNRCVYEELAWTCSGHGATANTPSDLLGCFDCDYKTCEVHFLKSHIYKEHMDSLFICTKHSFAEINDSCRECIYEKLVIQLKEV